MTPTQQRQQQQNTAAYPARSASGMALERRMIEKKRRDAIRGALGR